MANFLPPPGTTISESSSVKHPTLSASIFTLNDPSKFIFHTSASDKQPVILLDFGVAISVERIYLYNRSTNKATAERILGLRVECSNDGVEYKMVPINIENAFIYYGFPLELTVTKETRYLRFTKESGGVIHLSQITLGRPKGNDLLIDKFANVFGLIRGDNGSIYEHPDPNANQNFRVYGDIPVDNNFRIDAIRLRGGLRFANALLAYCNAIVVAEKVGAARLYIPECDSESGRILFGSKQTFKLRSGISVVFAEPDSGEIFLEGTFYYKNQQSLYKEGRSYTAIIEELRPTFGINTTKAPFEDNSVTIHLRSGDVFGHIDTVHPGYWQPPLAYYTFIIKQEKPSKVHLVFENTKNPVISPLIDYIAGIGLPYEIHNRTLFDDLDTLLSSTVIVAGRGTFINGVLALSKNVRRVFVFNDEQNIFSVADIDFRIIRDSLGDYVRAISNWRNTQEQRELMVNYREENLSNAVSK